MNEQELSLYCVDEFSSHFPAEVNAACSEKALIVGCSCQMAELGGLCLHLTRLINNDPSILARPTDPEQLANLALFQKWLTDTTCREDLSKVVELQRLKALVNRLRSGWKRKSCIKTDS
jgi:hypothetical protein